MHTRLLQRVYVIAFLTLALACTVHAGPHDAAINQFMKYTLDENESFTKERVGISNQYIISVGRFAVGLDTTYSVQDTFMIKVNESNESDVSIMKNRDEIEGALTDKYAFLNLTYESLYPTPKETGDILVALLEFNESREPQEGQCKLWTGIDRHECTDPQSCLRACFSTPLGNQVATGVGWPFVYVVWEFANQSRDMDANISSAIRHIHAIDSRSGDIDYHLKDLDLNLKEIQNATTNLTQSPLFDKWRYSFCWPINYNRTDLIIAKVLVKRLNERMDIVLSIPAQTELMIQSGTEREKLHAQNLEKELAKERWLMAPFWEKLSDDEKGFLKLFASRMSYRVISPVPVVSQETNWN